MELDLVPNNKCNYCNTNPNSHSFKQLKNSSISGKYVIFYSKVANAELYNNTESILHHFHKELEGIGEWYWIFDCKGMKFNHYIQFNLIKELAKLIELHGGLRRIYLLEPSWLIHMSIKCANIFMTLPEIIISTDGSAYSQF
jgi:hypothetical protein